jgi:hypothetical protein
LLEFIEKLPHGRASGDIDVELYGELHNKATSNLMFRGDGRFLDGKQRLAVSHEKHVLANRWRYHYSTHDEKPVQDALK